VTIENQKTAEHANESATGIGNAAQESLNAVRNSLTLAFDRNRAIAQKMARGMHDVSLEFLNARLERAGHAIERGRECQGVSEFMSLQRDWLVDAARDYVDLTKRFADVLHDAPHNGAVHAEAAVPAHDVANAEVAAPAHETAPSQSHNGGGDLAAA
jgi:hypothetical protein